MSLGLSEKEIPFQYKKVYAKQKEIATELENIIAMWQEVSVKAMTEDYPAEERVAITRSLISCDFALRNAQAAANHLYKQMQEHGVLPV